MTDAVLFQKPFLVWRRAREPRLPTASPNGSQDGSSNESGIACQSYSKVFSFTISPAIGGIAIYFNFKNRTKVMGGPSKPNGTNAPLLAAFPCESHIQDWSRKGPERGKIKTLMKISSLGFCLYHSATLWAPRQAPSPLDLLVPPKL